jgi:hypothetical protein
MYSTCWLTLPRSLTLRALGSTEALSIFQVAVIWLTFESYRSSCPYPIGFQWPQFFLSLCFMLCVLRYKLKLIGDCDCITFLIQNRVNTYATAAAPQFTKTLHHTPCQRTTVLDHFAKVQPLAPYHSQRQRPVPRVLHFHAHPQPYQGFLSQSPFHGHRL